MPNRRERRSTPVSLAPLIGLAILAVSTAAQDPEIEQMKAMLTSWDAPIEMDMTKPHDMSAMEGMLSLADIENLETLTGAEFDKTWATMMKEPVAAKGSPQHFEPTEKVRPDFDVAFPVDI